jgi:hypothetical protein
VILEVIILEIQELRHSSDKIGQLYPVIVDYHGNIIDGEHRIRANSNWRKVKLENIKTKKQLIIARILSNNLRRNVTKREKSCLLTDLAEINLSEGSEVGEITYKIAKQTGMSYRWVAKYLPKKYKDPIQSNKKKHVAHHATPPIKLKTPPKGILEIRKYRNTNFVQFIMDKVVFQKLENKAKELNTTINILIYNAILEVLC